MQYFNSSNSEVEFIKNLLRTTYIPTVRIFCSNINVQPPKTTSAVYEGNISSAMFADSSQVNNEYFVGETIVTNNNICVGEQDKAYQIEVVAKKYNQITSYNFGEWYKNITTNFVSNKSYYDSNLHENLGRYLRAYRDYYHIDVLNLYNCFSNRFITEWSLPFNGYSGSNAPYATYDATYKIMAFPIMYDTVYQVNLSSEVVGKITLQAVYFNGKIPIEPAEATVNTATGELIPKTYELDSEEEFCFRVGSADGLTGDNVSNDKIRKRRLSKQSLLYILIQFPAEVSGPITVLEQPKYTMALNNELLEINPYVERHVAFSDTLLEYLTGAVLSPASTARVAIHKLQDKIGSTPFYNKFGVGGPSFIGAETPNYKPVSGIFDEDMHKIIYRALYDYGENKKTLVNGLVNKIPNFMGYVDKNVESIFDTLA